MDSEITQFSEEAKRVVGVALLCTQAIAHVKASNVTRLVARLSGNAEIGTVTTTPDYLTHLNFIDVISPSFMSSTAQTASPNNTS